MVHPVQSVIDSLYAAGRCPRLHVNALHPGVVCPDFIREQWRERLIIDLDASYPLDLTFEDEGLAADLSFGGYVTRCSFPYAAIYVVADRSTGRGIVLDQNMPAAIKASRLGKPEVERAPKLQSVPSLQGLGDGTSAEASATEASPEPAAPQEPAPDGASAAASATDDREDVKKRRAAFRVIDGGG